MAKMIAGKMKKLPDDQKRGFMKKFYEKTKNHPEVDKLCNEMKQMIGYEKEDYR